MPVDFSSDWNVNKQKWKFLKIFVVLRLLDNFVQVIKILFTLIFSRKFMERTDNVFDFGFSLLNRLNFNLLFLMKLSQMELRLFLFFYLSFFFWDYLIFRFSIISLFWIFSAGGAFLFFLQEIFSSDHDILWSPVTSVLIFLIRFLFWRWRFKFFFLLFTWRISFLILKEFLHFFIKFRHDFIS